MFYTKDSKLLPEYVDFKPCYAKPLRIIFSAASADTLTVLESMLQLSPNRRCTCKEALQMPYFSNPPGPTLPEDLPLPISVAEQIKIKSDALKNNNNNNFNGKRKLSEETSGG